MGRLSPSKKQSIFVPKWCIFNKIENMIIVSSKEFRDHQLSYLDRVDSGEEILLQRGKNKSYRIVPVVESDTIVSKKFILSPR
jgi:hypothetical protein